MAYTTINKSTAQFNTKLYSGNGSTQSITGVGFQSDFTWIKERSSTSGHVLIDIVRGVDKVMRSNTNNAEATDADCITSFDSDGFSLGADVKSNENSQTYVSWNWKVGTGQGSSNTNGSINTTYTSVNTTAGFSISTYTGDGNDGATVGHGLGVTPNVVIIKNRSTSSRDWIFHQPDVIGTQVCFLNSTSAKLTNSGGVADQFNSTTVRLNAGSGGIQGINTNGDNYVMYCFANITGYSKFGKYSGNGNADGTFVYTGFRPTFLMVKRTDSTSNWTIVDSIREPTNNMTKYIDVNLAIAEGNYTGWSFLSNGFKFVNTDAGINANGGAFIYMAFGQSLVGSNNVPCVAR